MVGDMVQFAVEMNWRSQPQARDVSKLALAESQKQNAPAAYDKPTVESATFLTGKIKSMGTDFSFISCDETFALYHRDVILLPSELPEGLMVGDMVQFAVEMNW